MAAAPASPRVPVLGLTGAIAAGKCEALAALERLGAATLSADAVVHELLGTERVRDLLVGRWGERGGAGRGGRPRPGGRRSCSSGPRSSPGWSPPCTRSSGERIVAWRETLDAGHAARRGRGPAAVRDRDRVRVRRDDLRGRARAVAGRARRRAGDARARGPRRDASSRRRRRRSGRPTWSATTAGSISSSEQVEALVGRRQGGGGRPRLTRGRWLVDRSGAGRGRGAGGQRARHRRGDQGGHPAAATRRHHPPAGRAVQGPRPGADRGGDQRGVGVRLDQTSQAGARGLMQITPATADTIETLSGGDDVRRTTTSRTRRLNIRYGTLLPAPPARPYDGNVIAALAAYNGRQRERRRVGRRDARARRDRVPETRAYVEQVLEKRDAVPRQLRRRARPVVVAGRGPDRRLGAASRSLLLALCAGCGLLVDAVCGPPAAAGR